MSAHAANVGGSVVWSPLVSTMAKKSISPDGSDRQWLGIYNKVGGGDAEGFVSRRALLAQMGTTRPEAGVSANSASPARAVLLPPGCNTGGSLHVLTEKPDYVHIDYYRVTIWADSARLITGLSAMLPGGAAGWVAASRGAFFDKALKHTSGALLRFSPIGGGGYCLFELAGEACGSLAWGLANHAALVELCELNGWQWRLSRLDLAADGAPFTPADLRRQFDEGMSAKASRRTAAGKVARTNDGLPIVTELRARSWQWFENWQGSTVYLGSRQSDKLIRCYDKRGFTRLELEIKGEVAHVVGVDLLRVTDLRGFAFGLLRGFVDFPQWAEWGQFVTGEAVKVVVPVRVTNYERAMAWVRRSVLPTLESLAHVVGDLDLWRHEIERNVKPLSSAQIARHQMIAASCGAF